MNTEKETIIRLLCDCGCSAVMHDDMGKGNCITPDCGCRVFTQRRVITFPVKEEKLEP